MNYQALPVRIRCGATILVPNRLGVITSYVLLEQESWFEDEFEFVGSLLRPGEQGVDIGANFGVYTETMAEAVGPNGKIFAFEPTAETSTYLRATVQVKPSPQVEVIQAALSDHDGKAQMRSGWSPELNALFEPGAATTGGEAVEMVTLDKRLATRNAAITFIKIDAEGHELAVGRGARNVIMEDDPLIMFEIKHGEVIDLRFLEFLEHLGFTSYRLAPGLDLLVPFRRTAQIDVNQLNLFACSPTRAAHLQARGLLAHDTRSSRNPVKTWSEPESAADATRHLPFLAPRSAIYGASLDHFHCARQKNLEPDLRLAHARQSLQLAREAVTERRSMARCLTLARIAADFGDQLTALTMLRNMAGELTQLTGQTFDETCLGFPNRCSRESERAAPAEVLRITTLEAFERSREFSTCFSGVKSLPFLDYLCQSPLCSPEMHRRRQLIRMHQRLQFGPEPHPSLSADGPDNLNTWFWRR